MRGLTPLEIELMASAAVLRQPPIVAPFTWQGVDRRRWSWPEKSVTG